VNEGIDARTRSRDQADRSGNIEQSKCRRSNFGRRKREIAAAIRGDNGARFTPAPKLVDGVAQGLQGILAGEIEMIGSVCRPPKSTFILSRTPTRACRGNFA